MENRNMVNARASVDTHRIRQLKKDTGDEMLPELYAVFKRDVLAKQQAVAHAAQAENFKALSQAAHAMRGVVISFGAALLDDQLQKVLKACREETYELAVQHALPIPMLTRASLRAIELYINNI